MTGSVTDDGTLAAIYLPDATRTITIDPTRMGPGYTARWVDPTTGISIPTTTGTTYQHPTSNATGDPDWLLVLESDTPR